MKPECIVTETRNLLGIDIGVDVSEYEDRTAVCFYKEDAEVIIAALEKQVAKKPILVQHPRPSYRDFKCPVCESEVNRQWEYTHYEDRMIGEDTYDYCPWCGQKIDWEE